MIIRLNQPRFWLISILCCLVFTASAQLSKKEVKALNKELQPLLEQEQYREVIDRIDSHSNDSVVLPFSVVEKYLLAHAALRNVDTVYFICNNVELTLKEQKKLSDQVIVACDQVNQLVEAMSTLEELRRQEDHQEAFQFAQQLYAYFSDYWQASLALGAIYSDRENYDSAYFYIQQAHQFSSSKLVQYDLGKVYYNRGQLDSAEFYLSQLPEEDRAWYFLANIALKQGQNSFALKRINRAIQMNGSQYEYMLFRAELLYLMRDLPMAWKDYLRLYNQGDNNPTVTHNLYVITLKLRKYDLALTLIYQELKKPDLADPVFWKTELAKVYYNTGRYEEALDAYNKVLEKDSTLPKVYYQRANTLVKLKRRPEAIVDYLRAMELDPNEFSYAYEAHKFTFYNDKKGAAKIRRRARANMHARLEKDSTNAWSWFYLGQAYDLLDYMYETDAMNQKTIDYYSEAINRDSTQYKFYWERGTTYFFFKKDYRKCAADMEKASQLRPVALYFEYVALCYIKLKEWDKALVAAENGLEKFPDNDEMLGYKKQAEKYLNR